MNLEKRIKTLEKKVAALEVQAQEQPVKIQVTTNYDLEELSKFLLSCQQKQAFDLRLI